MLKESTIERVNDLVSKNKAFFTSGLYLYTETMMANSNEVLEAQRTVINNKKQKEKEDNDLIKRDSAKLKVNEAYLMYKNGEKCYYHIGKLYRCGFYQWMERVHHLNIALSQQ